MTFVYMCTAGADDPTRASVPIHLAVNGSLEVGQQVRLVLGGDAADLVVGDTAEKVQGVGVPSMKELLAKVLEHQVPVDV